MGACTEELSRGARLDGVHAIHARGLEDGVVRLVGGVENAVGQILAAHQDAMQIALRAAVCDVAPVLVLVDLPQPRKPLQHSNLRPTPDNVIKGWIGLECNNFETATRIFPH